MQSIPASSRWAGAIVGICLAVIVVYGSLLSAPALSWDDGVNIFENPYILSGQWSALWTDAYFGMYVPMISTTWAALLHLGAGAAWPFRLLNIVLHVANVVLFACVLRSLLRRVAWGNDVAVVLGAAIFALHPAQTAAVAWISGSRDLAATTLALVAVCIHFTDRRQAAWWSTLVFAAGLLCKPQIAGVPLAILLYAWLFERQHFRRTAVTMAAWSFLVIMSAVVTWFAQTDASSVQVPLTHRPVLAFDALGFYLIKVIWPHPLAADYGRTPEIVWAQPRLMIITFGTLALATGAWWAARQRSRAYDIALLWPLLLLPVLGLVTFTYQRISTVADHYNYLPLTVLAAVVAIATARAPWSGSRGAWMLPAAFVAASSTASWIRVQDWRDDDRFYADMLAKNPASFSAKINLAAAYCDRGEWTTGLALVEQSANQASEDPGFLANKAYCLYRAKRLDEVLSLQTELRAAGVRVGFARKPRAAAVFATSVAAAFDNQGQRLPAFAYLCQADAVIPGDMAVIAAIEEIQREFRARGQDIACPGLLSWDTLQRAVAEMH